MKKIIGILLSAVCVLSMSLPVSAAVRKVVNADSYFYDRISDYPNINDVTYRTANADKIIKKMNKANTRENLLKKHSSIEMRQTSWRSDLEEYAYDQDYFTSEEHFCTDGSAAYYIKGNHLFASDGARSFYAVILDDARDVVYSFPKEVENLEVDEIFERDGYLYITRNAHGKYTFYEQSTGSDDEYDIYVIDILDAKTFERKATREFIEMEGDIYLVMEVIYSYDVSPLPFYNMMKLEFNKQEQKMRKGIVVVDPDTADETIEEITLPRGHSFGLFSHRKYDLFFDREGTMTKPDNADDNSTVTMYYIRKNEQ